MTILEKNQNFGKKFEYFQLLTNLSTYRHYFERPSSVKKLSMGIWSNKFHIFDIHRRFQKDKRIIPITSWICTICIGFLNQ